MAILDILANLDGFPPRVVGQGEVDRKRKGIVLARWATPGRMPASTSGRWFCIGVLAMSFNGLRLSLMGTESRTARRKTRTSRRRQIELERARGAAGAVDQHMDGMGADANWSTPGTGIRCRRAGSDIVFPAGASSTDQHGRPRAGTDVRLIDDLGQAATRSRRATAARPRLPRSTRRRLRARTRSTCRSTCRRRPR